MKYLLNGNIPVLFYVGIIGLFMLGLLVQFFSVCADWR